MRCCAAAPSPAWRPHIAETRTFILGRPGLFRMRRFPAQCGASPTQQQGPGLQPAQLQARERRAISHACAVPAESLVALPSPFHLRSALLVLRASLVPPYLCSLPPGATRSSLFSRQPSGRALLLRSLDDKHPPSHSLPTFLSTFALFRCEPAKRTTKSTASHRRTTARQKKNRFSRSPGNRLLPNPEPLPPPSDLAVVAQLTRTAHLTTPLPSLLPDQSTSQLVTISTARPAPLVFCTSTWHSQRPQPPAASSYLALL